MKEEKPKDKGQSKVKKKEDEETRRWGEGGVGGIGECEYQD